TPPRMPDPRNGGPADLLVVHRCVPAPSSADPRSRQVFPRIVLLHPHTRGTVRVVALEHEPRADTAALAHHGIEVTIVAAGVQAGLLTALAGARAAWITDSASGGAFLRASRSAGRAVPYVADLERLPSEVATASGTRPDARNSDGLEHLVAERAETEAPVLRGAAAIAVTGERLAN